MDDTGRTVNLGGGQIVPYPEPTSAAATKIGKANKRQGTKAEVRLRSHLHRHGLRFRKDHLIRAGGVRVHADIAFTRVRVAIFVDGCFWHGCPDHQHIPKSNLDYWVPKLAANEVRDRRVDAALRGNGWIVQRIWEHEDEGRAVQLVLDAITQRVGVIASITVHGDGLLCDPPGDGRSGPATRLGEQPGEM